MPIYQKIQKVMKAVKGVEKDSENRHGRYKYAGHEAVTEALRDHFAELGIVRQVSATDCKVLDNGAIQIEVHVAYVDAEDESRIDVTMPAVQHSQTTAKTITAQQCGQALSYAVKNIEFKLFCLTGDTEADADSLPLQPANQPQQEQQRDWPPRQAPADNRSAQAAAHDRAAAMENVVVTFDDHDEKDQETAETGKEAAVLLATRLKASSYFHGSRMLQFNIEWIAKLNKDWQDRLEAIVHSKRDEESGKTKDHFGGSEAA